MIYISVLSQNLKLILTEASDTDKKFLDYRTELSGNVESNMTKIDDAFGNVQNHINDKTNPHKVSPEQIGADPAGSADSALEASKLYTDEQISKIPVPDVSSQIQEHNNDEKAHGSILSKFNDVVIVDGGASMQLNEAIGGPPYTIIIDDDADDINSLKPKKKSIILYANQWVNNLQTIVVDGISADENKQIIQPVPYLIDQEEYIETLIICSGQGENSLTFKCSETPSKNLNVYIVIQEVATE